MSTSSDSQAMNRRLCGVGIFLVVLGAAGYGFARWGNFRIEHVATWPSAAGRIVTSEVATSIIKTGRVRQVTPVANVRFAYSVDGQRYEGEHLRVIPMLHSKPMGTPEEIVARYRLGKAVQVYYDPAKPGDSLLIPAPADDARGMIRAITFVGLSIGFMGLLMVIIGAVQLRSADPASQPASAVPVPTRAARPAAVTPPRGRWALRSLAITFGTIFLLFGGLLASAAACTPSKSGSIATQVVALAIFAAVALLGAGLIYVGVRRPRPQAFALTASA